MLNLFSLTRTFSIGTIISVSISRSALEVEALPFELVSVPCIHDINPSYPKKLAFYHDCFSYSIFLGILDTILSVQPKEGGNTGGETRESIVYQLADDMLRKLPPAYNAYEVKENLNRMGALLPMNIFLR